ncbi:MAG: ribose transport system ATP-binding protein [Fimbriimonadaceae bacterium]|nr:ribose transport system ATP-binding protein [Fimbriimonadaceae bacterium]
MAIVLECRQVSKSFPGVRALDAVSIQVETASCHGLVGENGAGKSTLGKILAGLYSPDDGEILLDGRAVHFRSPNDAMRAGIGIVHQELLFCENLSVAENLNLHKPPSRLGFYDRNEGDERAKRWLQAIDANVDPEQAVGELTVAKQQLVQIAGAMSLGARILIFDEPTSSLSQVEAERLMACIRELKSKGVTCIYVSHRMEEVFEICDHVTVLRDGKLVGTKAIAETSRQELVSMMVGRELDLATRTIQPPTEAAEVLRVTDLSVPGKVSDVGFAVRSGEIVGLAGLVGSGRTETLEALFGLNARATAQVTLKGKLFRPSSPARALQAGMGLIPEDRKRHGLVLMMSAKQNISLPILSRLSRAGLIRRRRERELARAYFDRLRIKAPTLDANTAALSGGNQQKLVLAKWVAAECDVLLVDEPTRGIDVGAKAEIHNLLRELAEQGKAIVVASSELPELLALCTRILVLREGRIVGELDQSAADENAIMRMMAGVAVA